MKEARMNHAEPGRLITALGAVFLAAIVTLPFFADAQEVPSGTSIRVRTIDRLSSEQNQAGDTFHATLNEPVTVNGQELYPKGADVLGRVTEVHKAGQLSPSGELDLVLLTISSSTFATSVRVQPLVIKGESHTRSNPTKIGANAGSGVVATTGKKPATVDSEAVLTFTASTAPIAAPPASGGEGGPTPPALTSSAPVSPEAATAVPGSAAPAPASPATTGEHAITFTLRDRRIIRNCVSEHASDFPPGSTELPEVPAGSEPQISRGLRLSSDQEKQVQSLPLACEQQLPGLPGDLERVLYEGRILLLDGDGRIRDLFVLEDQL
jgi:hypothetical protein